MLSHLQGLTLRTSDDGPTTEELDAIEREWPAIEAELALVDAEIRVLTADGGPSLLDWRRLRRAERRVVREAAALAACRIPTRAELAILLTAADEVA